MSNMKRDRDEVLAILCICYTVVMLVAYIVMVPEIKAMPRTAITRTK